MADDNDEKGFVIFGNDIAKIPCFRSSFLYGISGGIASGLGYFLFTSRVKRATDVSVISFALITMAYWAQCRYSFSQKKFEMQRLQELMRKQSLYEGTEQERELQAKLGSKAQDA